MSDLNLCQFIGRLGKPPETRYTPDGKAICSFGIAVGSQWKNKAGEKQESTEWVSITAFDKLGEICSKYLDKGSLIHISGRMKTDKYTDKQGVEKYSTKIIAENMQMLGGKKDGDGKQDAHVEAKSNGYAPNKTIMSDAAFDIWHDVPFAPHGKCGAGVSWRCL